MYRVFSVILLFKNTLCQTDIGGEYDSCMGLGDGVRMGAERRWLGVTGALP